MSNQVVGWISPETAPLNEPVLLAVRCEDGFDFRTEDDSVFRAVGSRLEDGSTDGEWTFAGWCWQHDIWVNVSSADNKGFVVVGWLPLPSLDNSDVSTEEVYRGFCEAEGGVDHPVLAAWCEVEDAYGEIESGSKLENFFVQCIDYTLSLLK